MKGRRGMRNLINQKQKLIERLANNNQELANALVQVKLPWYTIKNQDDDDELATIFIYDEIGGWWGTPADEFVKELHSLTAKTIEVRINSPGGSVFDSIAIYNALIKKSAKVVTYVDSLAASGASVIAMAGDEIVMMRGSQMMIHDALGLEWGNAADMEAMADFLSKQSDNIAGIYADKAGGEIKEWRARMLAETWLFADEAIELGLADRIYTAKDQEEEEEAKPEEEDDDEEEMPPMPPDMDNAIEDLMKNKHDLSNRGYKYGNRSQAPDPVDSWESVRNLFKVTV